MCVISVNFRAHYIPRQQVTADVSQLLGGNKVDAILCVAGGWAGGSAKAKGKLLCSGGLGQLTSACNPRQGMML